MSGAGRQAGGRVGFVVVLLVVLVVGAYLFARPQGSDVPLDPRSTAPLGTRALVLLLEEQGAEVQLSDDVPEAGEVDAVLVLEDRVDDAGRDELLGFARAGGRLVVADPASPMTPPVGGVGDLLGDGTLDRGTCDVEVLEDLDGVEVPAALLYEVSSRGDAVSCFGDGETAFVVLEPTGGGSLVSIGGAAGFTNQQLDRADDAPLAVNLLAPESGSVVRLVSPPGLGADGVGGDAPDGLADLVDRSLVAALVQLLVAFLFVAAWRAVRLGKPVQEPQPIDVEGSELVAAVGRLLQQNRNPAAAAALLQHDARRTFEERLGVPADLPPEVAVELVVARTGIAESLVARALLPGGVADDGDLVEVARSIESIRAEVLHGRRP